jgi:hypothetical protein
MLFAPVGSRAGDVGRRFSAYEDEEDKDMEWAMRTAAFNPGNNAVPRINALRQVLELEQVSEAVESILGPRAKLHPHRQILRAAPGLGADQLWHESWHQESFFGFPSSSRSHFPHWLILLYFPQDTSLDMGPIELLPGSHFFSLRLHQAQAGWNASNYMGSLVDPIPITCKAGTIVLAHYDIWYRILFNRSSETRYIVKFLYVRMEMPSRLMRESSGSFDPLREWNIDYDVDKNIKELIEQLKSDMLSLSLCSRDGARRIVLAFSSCLDHITTEKLISIAEIESTKRIPHVHTLIKLLLQNAKNDVDKDAFSMSDVDTIEKLTDGINSFAERFFSSIYKLVCRKARIVSEYSDAWISLLSWLQDADIPTPFISDSVDLHREAKIITSPLEDPRATQELRFRATYRLSLAEKVNELVSALAVKYPANIAVMYGLCSLRREEARAKAVSLLLDLDDPDQEYRWQILYIVGHLQYFSENLLCFLSGSFSSKDSWVRREAISAIGLMHSCIPDSNLEALLRSCSALFDDTDPLVRMALFLSLSRIGHRAKTVSDKVINALQDSNRYIRCYSIWTLREIVCADSSVSAIAAPLLHELEFQRWCQFTTFSSPS